MNVTVALGGGGTRGTAHIGVLRALEQSGFTIRAVAGTSMGAIVGAFYASGRTPDEIEDIFASVDQARLYGWPLSEGAGILATRGIQDFLKSHLGTISIQDLKIPFAAVAVDLNSHREIFLEKGPLVEAILGSIAVPGLFPPRELEGLRLIDGGTLDPIPVRAARGLAPTLPVIAVSLMAPLGKPEIPLGVVTLPASIPIGVHFERMHIAQAFRVFAESVDIGSRQMAQLRLSIDEPELIIRPDVNGINLLDKVDVKEIAKRGEVATVADLSSLYKTVRFSSRLSRQIRRFLRQL